MGNNLSTIIKINWELDIDIDEDVQADLGLTQKQADIVVSDPKLFQKTYSKACELYGLPNTVDMSTYFNDPHTVSSSHITDVLSDEFGWLVKDFVYLRSV